MGALLEADMLYRAAEDAAWNERVLRMGAAAAGARPFPGSTATLALTYLGWPAIEHGHEQQGTQRGPPRQMLAVAHLGDSRLVVCRGGQVCCPCRR